MSNSTRDWLLDKLLKMRVALTEQKADYERQLAVKNLLLEKAAEEVRQAQLQRDTAVEDMKSWAARVHQMAPEKQFAVVYRGSSGSRIPLAILAVNSAAGKTTITVERAP